MIFRSCKFEDGMKSHSNGIMALKSVYSTGAAMKPYKGDNQVLCKPLYKLASIDVYIVLDSPLRFHCSSCTLTSKHYAIGMAFHTIFNLARPKEQHSVLLS